MQRETSPVRMAMLRRLLKRGFEVAAFDADPARTRLPAEAGAAEASSAAEIGRRYVGFGFEPEANACLTGEDGALESMDAGDCVAVRSTAPVDGARDLARICADRGVGFLDAPVGGGRRNPACAGRRSRRRRGAVASGTFRSEHMGDIGHGPVAKTMNNYLLRANGCAPIEAGRLASAVGLPKLRKALSSGDSAALRDRMTFAWALKDVQMMEKLSEGENMTLPLAGLVEELVKDGRAVKATDTPDWTSERRLK